MTGPTEADQGANGWPYQWSAREVVPTLLIMQPDN